MKKNKFSEAEINYMNNFIEWVVKIKGESVLNKLNNPEDLSFMMNDYNKSYEQCIDRFLSADRRVKNAILTTMAGELYLESLTDIHNSRVEFAMSY